MTVGGVNDNHALGGPTNTPLADRAIPNMHSTGDRSTTTVVGRGSDNRDNRDNSLPASVPGTMDSSTSGAWSQSAACFGQVNEKKNEGK